MFEILKQGQNDSMMFFCSWAIIIPFPDLGMQFGPPNSCDLPNTGNSLLSNKYHNNPDDNNNNNNNNNNNFFGASPLASGSPTPPHWLSESKISVPPPTSNWKPFQLGGKKQRYS